MKYYGLLTSYGEKVFAEAAALGTKIELTHMAVGDGGGSLPTPDTKQTKLVNEKRRGAINTLFVDPLNANQIIAEQIIPENEGGWWVREMGLFDKSGFLVAITNCPETYKPQLAEGSGRTQTIRMVLITSHTESVTLKIDPSVVLATREFVDSSVKKGIEEHEKSRKHPDATTAAKGFVQLADTLSADNTKAITPKLATEINQRATNAQTTATTANTNATNANNNANNRVPNTRKVNNKPLSEDINLTAGDVNAYDKNESDTKFQPKGNYAPAGNYQPAGNYADGNLYRIGNNKLESWVYTPDKTKVFNVNNSGLSGVYDWNTNRYLWGFSADGVMTTGLIPVTCGGTNAKNSIDARKNLGALGVGDYGIGLTPATATNIAPVDDIDRWDLAQGFYKVYNKSKGERPAGVVADKGFCLHVSAFGTAPGGAYVTQTAFYYSDTNSETYRRSFDPRTSTWTKWSKLYSEGNTYTDQNGCLKASGSSSVLSDCRVGIPLPWPQATAPAGYLICNGQSFNKTTYPFLAQAYPSGVLPDLRSEFIRGLDAGRNIDTGRGVLSTQGDAIRNITGEMSEANDRMINFSGAFYDGGFVGGSSGLSGGRAGHKVRFDASRVVPTANENRPRNIAFLYIVRAA